MKKIIGLMLLVAGCCMITWALFDYYSFSYNSSRELERVVEEFNLADEAAPVSASARSSVDIGDAKHDADRLTEKTNRDAADRKAIEERTPDNVKPEKQFERSESDNRQEDLSSFSTGDALGILSVDSIGLTLPIFEGVDPSTLQRGIGHEPTTWMPGENEQIFLAGHNDSAFLKLKDVAIGDTISFQTKDGVFQYEIVDEKIVDAEDTWVIGEMDQEVLVLMTCFPFYSWQDPPERYLIYATPA